MIRKVIFALTVALLTSLSASAALTAKTLSGRWVSNEISEDLDGSSAIKYCTAFHFNDNGQVSLTLSYNYSTRVDGQRLSGNMYASIHGNYQIEGNSIIIKFVPGSITYEAPMSEVKVSGRGEYTRQDVQATLEQLAERIAANFSSGAVIEDCTVVSSKKIKCTFNDDKLTLTKVSKKRR